VSEITRSPLCWPDNVPRTPPHLRTRPLFSEKTLAYAVEFVEAEIDRLNQVKRGYTMRNSVIISSNLRLRNDGLPYSGQPEPSDTGIAVYFPLQFHRGGKVFERPIVLTCDRWTKIAWNLYAIAKDIEAQRARDRWGCTNFEQAFRGYLAIPERCGGRPWWDTLDVESDATAEEVEAAFKTLAKTHHPDKGGTPEDWAKLQEAYDQAKARFAA
jgi:curved DNA-binding protein CbpA